MTQYWLFKTEPDCYSIDDLARESHQTTRWDGIRNYQARNFLRDQVAMADRVFIYHSRCKPMGIVGTATISRASYPDPQQFNPQNPYFDDKASMDTPRWFCVDVTLTEKFPHIITLEQIKHIQALDTMILRKQGRLSIQPVTEYEWKTITQLSRM
ncbi:EVE domain-containing protein [Gilvimarinus polysaccharolyticus]|uniref:EVE domain-containing protein n=1 Tax=Gilvimarinus polysaccharolyticus TaxID=863921 RepID=UPI000673675F|nr:EVE domain-containing protein [Gilvimarinus polysaccharolyticus]